MPKITISPVKGEAPIVGYGQANDIASCAINTKFWHGLLEPFQCPTLHCTKSEDIKTMLSLDECECVTWDSHVDIASCYCEFIFWTGDGKPKISTKDEICNGDYCNLGVPCPVVAPIVSFNECNNVSDECKEKCSSDYDECIIAANSECDALYDEVGVLFDAYTSIKEGDSCGDCSDESDKARDKWAEKLEEYNKCLKCKNVLDAIDECKKEKTDCIDGCGDSKCNDEQFSSFLVRYINKYGHVGAPSKPSEFVPIYNYDTEVFNIQIPAPLDGYCVTDVEIFVLIAGNKTGLEKNVANNSGFMSVGVFPLSGNITFSIEEIGFEIDSSNYFPPVDNLKGITCHDYGLVGFEGKNIWYTESNIVNAWSMKKCLDHEIKCIEYWNGALFAFTDEWVYRMSLIESNDGYDFSTPFRFGDRPFPIIGRPSKGQAGIFFPSVLGGVLITRDSAKIITSKFAKDDWLSLCHDKETSFTAVFDYGVGIFTKKASYVFEFGDNTTSPAGEVYQLPFIADAAMVDKNGILNYAVGNEWYKWDSCYECKEPCDETPSLTECCCPYDWRSMGIIFDTQILLTAGYIEFEPSTGDVKLEIFERDCFDDPIYTFEFNEGTDRCQKNRCFRKYFRIPSCRVLDQIYVRLSGCAKVRKVVLGTSRSALRK